MVAQRSGSGLPSAPRTFVVVESIGDLSQNAFATKLEQVLRKGGYRYQFWGWDRNRKQADRALEREEHKKILLRGGGQARWQLGLYYLIWMAAVFWTTLRNRTDAVYICSRFDAAFPVAVASLFARRPLLFANRDNISMSYRWPGPVKWLFKKLEEFVARRSVVHLLPSESRWHERSPNVRVVPNTPTRDLLAEAREIADRKGYRRPDDALVLYVNGWLTARRGARMILEALRECTDSRVRTLVAGTPLCPEAEDLLRLENVTYLGTLSAAESLAVYFGSHVVLTFYDPAIEINRLAEPNKWGDCIATGTPFITNSEVVTARKFIEADACFHVPYGDSRGLRDTICELVKDRQRWKVVHENLCRYQLPAWDEAMGDVLAELA